MSCHDCNCDRCRAERTQRKTDGGTSGFFVTGGRDLIETLIVDLRHIHFQNVAVIDGEAGESNSRLRARREAVIILYASGQAAVFEGWNVKYDHIPELLAAKVLKDD